MFFLEDRRPCSPSPLLASSVLEQWRGAFKDSLKPELSTEQTETDAKTRFGRNSLLFGLTGLVE